VMAYIVGTGLIILVFAAVPLQYGANLPQLAEIVGPIHGAMYIIYLASAVDLARREGLTTRQLVMIFLAGFVPFVAFVVERKVTSRVLADLEELARTSGGGSARLRGFGQGCDDQERSH